MQARRSPAIARGESGQTSPHHLGREGLVRAARRLTRGVGDGTRPNSQKFAAIMAKETGESSETRRSTSFPTEFYRYSGKMEVPC